MIDFLTREWGRALPRLPDWSRRIKQEPRAIAYRILDRALRQPCNEKPMAPTDESLIHRRDLSIHIARSADCEGPIDQLVRRKYDQRGYVAPQACPRTATSGTVVLDARMLGRCVGTLCVRLDSAQKLYADATFGEEVQRLRGPGRLLCEFGHLALDASGASKKDALALLFHVGYVIAYRIHHASHLVIEVNPRHVAFYRRRLGFAIAGEQRRCTRVGAPAVLLYRTLHTLAGDVVRFAGLPLRGRPSFYAHGLAPWEEAELVGRVCKRLAAPGTDQRCSATPG